MCVFVCGSGVGESRNVNNYPVEGGDSENVRERTHDSDLQGGGSVIWSYCAAQSVSKPPAQWLLLS